MSTADENTPTEEQTQEANAAEEARWQGDFNEEDLTVPYKREADDDEKTPETDTDEEEVVPDNQETYSEPAPVVTIEDPGEYTPADYSFDVTLKDGKSVKITTPDEAEKLSEDPDNFETPKQLLDFIKKSTQMQSKLDKDHDKWQEQKNLFDTQTQTENQRQETINTMAGEFEYLVKKKLMPEIAKEDLDADWSDPEIAKKPGVKEQIELLNYMVKENEIRAKAKVKPLTSIVDAYNAWQLDTGRQKREKANKDAGEARKAASAKVAGVSPTQTGTYVPKGIAVGRVLPQRSVTVWDN